MDTILAGYGPSSKERMITQDGWLFPNGSFKPLLPGKTHEQSIIRKFPGGYSEAYSNGLVRVSIGFDRAFLEATKPMSEVRPLLNNVIQRLPSNIRNKPDSINAWVGSGETFEKFLWNGREFDRVNNQGFRTAAPAKKKLPPRQDFVWADVKGSVGVMEGDEADHWKLFEDDGPFSYSGLFDYCPRGYAHVDNRAKEVVIELSRAISLDYSFISSAVDKKFKEMFPGYHIVQYRSRMAGKTANDNLAGWWYNKKSKQLIDVRGDMGGGSNDHVGFLSANENWKLLGISKEDADLLAESYAHLSGYADDHEASHDWATADRQELVSELRQVGFKVLYSNAKGVRAEHPAGWELVFSKDGYGRLYRTDGSEPYDTLRELNLRLEVSTAGMWYFWVKGYSGQYLQKMQNAGAFDQKLAPKKGWEEIHLEVVQKILEKNVRVLLYGSMNAVRSVHFLLASASDFRYVPEILKKVQALGYKFSPNTEIGVETHDQGNYISLAWEKAQFAQSYADMNKMKREARLLMASAEEEDDFHMNFQGMDIIVEWPKGSEREGTDENGKPWKRVMHADYGYINDTTGAGDREPVDVYVGEDDNAEAAFVVEQLKEDGSFDEYKVMLGFPTLEAARECYLAHYPTGWEETRVGGIYEAPVDDLESAVDDHTEKTAAPAHIRSYIWAFEDHYGARVMPGTDAQHYNLFDRHPSKREEGKLPFKLYDQCNRGYALVDDKNKNVVIRTSPAVDEYLKFIPTHIVDVFKKYFPNYQVVPVQTYSASAKEAFGDSTTFAEGCVMVNAPASVLGKIEVAEEDLAPYGREYEPHVTVRFGLQGNDLEGIRDLALQMTPFTITLGKTKVFPPGKHSAGAAVVVVSAEAPELHELNQKLGEVAHFSAPTFPTYQPHLTVAYVKPEVADKYVGLSTLDGFTFQVNELVVSSKSKEETEIALGTTHIPGGLSQMPAYASKQASVDEELLWAYHPNYGVLVEKFDDGFGNGYTHAELINSRMRSVKYDDVQRGWIDVDRARKAYRITYHPSMPTEMRFVPDAVKQFCMKKLPGYKALDTGVGGGKTARFLTIDECREAARKAANETVEVPMGRGGQAKNTVSRWWYHDVRGRGFAPDGGIAAYSIKGMPGDREIAARFPNGDCEKDKFVYLSPFPLTEKAVAVDLKDLDLNEFRLTGQAEGYGVYRGDIPYHALAPQAAIKKDASTEQWIEASLKGYWFLQ